MNTAKRQHHNLDAEASVLGGIMLRPEILKRLDTVEEPDFYSPKHRVVWQAMLSCADRGAPLDIVSIGAEIDRLGKAGIFNDGMQRAFLADLQLSVPSAENVQHYVEIIQAHRVVRDLRVRLAECQSALDSADNVGDDDFEGAGAVQWVQRQISTLKTHEADDGTIGIGKLAKQRVAQLEQIAEERASGKRSLTGLPTGVRALDEAIGGYQVGIPTVIAARPRMGKSSLMRDGANAISKAGYGTHTFSVEDLRERFADRVISAESRVPAETLRTCSMNRGEMQEVGYALTRLYQRNGWLINDRSFTALQVVRCWRRHGEANKTKAVFIDYLQRLRKRDYRMSDFEHVSESLDILADAAKQDGIALVVGSQLNRECEKRPNKRPQMADMRGGGPIEEISKCIVGMYRGCVYGDPVDGEDFNVPGAPQYRPTPQEWERQCELILIKNNDGQEGRVFVQFDGPTTRVIG
jgi:replicative DNA helicase